MLCDRLTKFQLGLFAVILGQSLEKEGTETGTGSSTEGVEDEESLQSRASIRESSKSVENGVDQLFSDLSYRAMRNAWR